MKKQYFHVLLASVMLVAMSLASCKTSNKPAESSRIGEIPEAAQYIVGIEKYDSLIDYSQAENWLDVPAAMVKDGVLDATFFFNNLKQNVADRIKAFVEK